MHSPLTSDVEPTRVEPFQNELLEVFCFTSFCGVVFVFYVFFIVSSISVVRSIYYTENSVEKVPSSTRIAFNVVTMTLHVELTSVREYLNSVSGSITVSAELRMYCTKGFDRKIDPL